jgi:hypothetical protein
LGWQSREIYKTYFQLALPKSGFIRRFGLFLLIFQSVGIRFFSGQGFIIGFVLLVMIFPYVTRYFGKRDLYFFILTLIFLTISKVVNPSFSTGSFLYQLLIVYSAYLFLMLYKPLDISYLAMDLYKVLRIFTVYSLIGYLIYLVVPGSFSDLSVMNKTFGHLFFVSQSFAGGFVRNTGCFWEPGVAQLVFNLCLFLGIMTGQKKKSLIVSFLAVLSTFSTAGFIILFVIVLYYFISKFSLKKVIVPTLFFALFFIYLFPLIQSNVLEKTDSSNTSGLTRTRDMLIGFELIKEKPIFGHGLFDPDYLMSKGYVNEIENDLFSQEYLDVSGEVSGGYTNGFLGLFAWYGIPIGLLVFIKLYKNPVVTHKPARLVFFLIMILSCFSEPVTYTALFILFPISAYLFPRIKPSGSAQYFISEARPY